MLVLPFPLVAPADDPLNRVLVLSKVHFTSASVFSIYANIRYRMMSTQQRNVQQRLAPCRRQGNGSTHDELRICHQLQICGTLEETHSANFLRYKIDPPSPKWDSKHRNVEMHGAVGSGCKGVGIHNYRAQQRISSALRGGERIVRFGQQSCRRRKQGDMER